MTAFHPGRSFVLDHHDPSLERSLRALLDDDELPAEDRAALAELARTTDPHHLAAALLELIGLPWDAAADAGHDLARRLGHARLARCVDTLARGLARHGRVLDRRQLRALSDDALLCA